MTVKIENNIFSREQECELMNIVDEFNLRDDLINHFLSWLDCDTTCECLHDFMRDYDIDIDYNN